MNREAIRAIETEYQGYRFRSRLEARWAVYFDALGLRWDYEREGFDLDGTYYLPDFWLPQVRMWAEVKPGAFEEDELRKAALLAWKDRPVILLEGVPDLRTYDFLDYMPCDCRGEIGDEIGVTVGEDEGMIQRFDCVISMFQNYPVLENRFFACTGKSDPYFDDGELWNYRDVAEAVYAARYARFERGRGGRAVGRPVRW
jgi:hypothetical protein